MQARAATQILRTGERVSSMEGELTRFSALRPSDDYTDAWLRALPQTIRNLVFIAKRYQGPFAAQGVDGGRLAAAAE